MPCILHLHRPIFVSCYITSYARQEEYYMRSQQHHTKQWSNRLKTVSSHLDMELRSWKSQRTETKT